MIKAAIAKVVEGQDLTEAEMIDVMDQIMGGEATPAQIGAFITALRMKGETVAEITGAARVMRERATPIRVGRGILDIDRDDINIDQETILDVVGTGGDGTNTFNISTTVAFVVSACGVKVAKHGNRSVSSSCGSADVLEALGVNLDVTPAVVEECIEAIGIGFLFAPALHGAMKYAIGPRKEIGIRTIFNILGPLTNPAKADCQVMGVYREELVEPLARVLHNLGCRRGFVVHGSDGMDEITLTGETVVASVTRDGIELSRIAPEPFGLKRCTHARPARRRRQGQRPDCPRRAGRRAGPAARRGAAQRRLRPGRRRQGRRSRGRAHAGCHGDRLRPRPGADREAGRN